MATLAQILTSKYPGQWLSIGNVDVYSTIRWSDAAPQVRPTEAAIRAFSAEVDAEIAEARALDESEEKLRNGRRDAVLWSLERLASQINLIRLGLPPQVRDGIDWTDLQRLATALQQARS